VVIIKKHTEDPSHAVKISVVIPTYNEEESVGEVLRKLLQIESLLPSMEIIVVDDGSTDRTAEEVAKFPSVKYVRHEKNVGKGAALRTGFKAATGNIFVIQDADLEYFPSDIPKLIEPILSGRADVVYGSRFKGKIEGMSFSHYLGNKILSLTTRLLYRAPVTDIMTGHKCFSKQVFKSMNLKENGFNIEAEIVAEILEGGWRFTEVPITYSCRKRGFSKIRYIDGIKCLWVLARAFYKVILGS